ncbi:unnamed protein product [Caretta caretta]
MKVSVAALAFVLSTACSSQASNDEGLALGPHMTTVCCFSCRFQKIPRSIVAEYLSPAACAPSQLLFITKKGREICTNPKDAWVQQYVNDLKRSISRDRQW